MKLASRKGREKYLRKSNGKNEFRRNDKDEM